MTETKRPWWSLPLGLASFVPLMALIYTLLVALAPGLVGATSTTPAEHEAVFSTFLAAVLILGFFSMVLTLGFIIFIFRSKRVANDRKALWAVVLFMANALIFPVFWYTYFWKATSNG